MSFHCHLGVPSTNKQAPFLNNQEIRLGEDKPKPRLGRNGGRMWEMKQVYNPI